MYVKKRYLKKKKAKLNKRETDTKSSEAKTDPKLKLLNKQKQEQLALEKKKILISLYESAKENKKVDKLFDSNFHYEPLSSADESKLLYQMKSILDTDSQSLSPTRLYTYRRFKSKLELRKLKRSNHLPLFDIDSYVNELIDSEKFSTNSEPTQQDVIFESETLATNLSIGKESDCEIIAIKRVLDRFKTNSRRLINHAQETYLNRFLIGMVESRNDDVKCIISPFTNK